MHKQPCGAWIHALRLTWRCQVICFLTLPCIPLWLWLSPCNARGPFALGPGLPSWRWHGDKLRERCAKMPHEGDLKWSVVPHVWQQESSDPAQWSLEAYLWYTQASSLQGQTLISFFLCGATKTLFPSQLSWKKRGRKNPLKICFLINSWDLVQWR